jgi:hypothetical protein
MQMMQNKWVGTGLGLVGGQIAGRVLGSFLGSSTGERLMSRIGGGITLSPLESRVLARKWSGNLAKAFSATAAALVVTRRDEPSGDHVIRTGTMAGRNVDWVQVMQRAGEIMLAAGAIFRVLGEYLEDRQKVAQESGRRTAKRLT